MKPANIREQWTIRVIFFTALLFLMLSFLFARLQNPDPAPGRKQTDASAMKVFENRGCPRCHSLSGKGNENLPLDGIGSKMTIEEIKNWITADPAIRSRLNSGIVNFKTPYSEIPEHEMNQLLNLLVNSR